MCFQGDCASLSFYFPQFHSIAIELKRDEIHCPKSALYETQRLLCRESTVSGIIGACPGTERIPMYKNLSPNLALETSPAQRTFLTPGCWLNDIWMPRMISEKIFFRHFPRLTKILSNNSLKKLSNMHLGKHSNLESLLLKP